MSRTDLHADMMNAMIDVVLKHVEDYVKGLRADTSATAPEHVIGYEAGFRAAKREILELLDDCT